jgi:hypothetical protein
VLFQETVFRSSFRQLGTQAGLAATRSGLKKLTIAGNAICTTKGRKLSRIK